MMTMDLRVIEWRSLKVTISRHLLEGDHQKNLCGEILICASWFQYYDYYVTYNHSGYHFNITM